MEVPVFRKPEYRFLAVFKDPKDAMAIIAAFAKGNGVKSYDQCTVIFEDHSMIMMVPLHRGSETIYQIQQVV